MLHMLVVRLLIRFQKALNLIINVHASHLWNHKEIKKFLLPSTLFVNLYLFPNRLTHIDINLREKG